MNAPGIRRRVLLIASSVAAIFPILVIIMNSVKARVAIFQNPYRFPSPETLSFVGYQSVVARSSFGLYYLNSFIITTGSIVLILFFATMVTFAFAQYSFRLKGFLRVFFLLGILIPIRLASVPILNIMLRLNLVNSLIGLIIIYIAQGLPMAILIFSQFMETVPTALTDAARIDGAREFRVYLMVLPLIKPALGTVAAFTMLPIWNDLWFPLILAPGEKTRTLTLGALQFMGQFSSDWNALLAALTLSIVPVLVLYFFFSRRIVGSMTIGAVK